MTTSELEHRLTAVLHQHAEEAMSRTDTEGRLQNLLVDGKRGARRRRRAWAAAAVVAAAAVLALVVSGRVPGLDRAESPVPAKQATATDVALSFLDAYGAFDRDRAATYLAPDGRLSLFGENWRQGNQWLEAAGFRQLLTSCEKQATLPTGTEVRCPFDYHLLRSEDIGRGPFSDNVFTFTIRDGKIVAANQDLAYGTNGFSSQMWEPFAAWVAQTYPEDVAVMYADGSAQSVESHSPQSLALWAKHTRDYVTFVNEGS